MATDSSNGAKWHQHFLACQTYLYRGSRCRSWRRKTYHGEVSKPYFFLQIYAVKGGVRKPAEAVQLQTAGKLCLCVSHRNQVGIAEAAPSVPFGDIRPKNAVPSWGAATRAYLRKVPFKRYERTAMRRSKHSLKSRRTNGAPELW